MGLFNRFRKKRKEQNLAIEQAHSERKIPQTKEISRFLEHSAFISELLSRDEYISRKEYIQKAEEFQDEMKFFSVLKDSNMLAAYCTQNGVEPGSVESELERMDQIDQLVENHNKEFVEKSLISEKLYLDGILDKIDPMIQLDTEQRRAVLVDEDNCLIIAGAGAGKTTTVAAKVKYLVEKIGIEPKQILVVSFTNKAVQELRDRINKDLGIECTIATFHSIGNEILHKNSPDEKLYVVDEVRLYYVLRDYFRNSVLKNDVVVNKLILFFASYFDIPYEGQDISAFFNSIAKTNFSTMRSELEDFKREVIDTRSRKRITIQNEILRSHQEVEIANFLYLNGIDYEYEPLYQYDIYNARKPYTPDFIIRQDNRYAYIEHFGINEDGTNYLYSNDQLQTYKKAVNDKIRLHRLHNTTLLYTFSAYNDKRTITEHLADQLEANGFVLKPKSNKEIMKKLVTDEENRYIRRFVNLVCRFISNFKVNAYSTDDFNRMYYSTQNVRSRLFLDICADCYLEYERYLKENNAVDFQDMINNSAKILREVQEMKQKLDFRYIIVDEYQDISRQRFDLTTALSEVTDAKIIAVGDDWQSIYAFSGSDITLFTKFKEKMGYAALLKIVNTYRNSQEVIDIAGGFIQRNTKQITKTLKSTKRISDPVIIYTYDASWKKKNADRRNGINYSLANAVEEALGQIVEYSYQERKKPGTVLLLGRFGFDGDNLERTGLFEYKNRGNKVKSVKYPNIDITFMTAHSSKGLGYDNVIVINGRNETYGFPAKIEDDPVLSFVVKEDHSIDYAEERRLFYVAMTRTKNRVYFVAPEQNPSEFLLEIKQQYKNVVLRGQWNEDKKPYQIFRKTCPICGYPLQFRYKNAYGLKLYICTNEPEICSFMTNEIKAGKMSIQKCDRCRDGYLIVKPGKEGIYFLGCTNYSPDGKGCDNKIWKQQYYEMMGYDIETEKKEQEKKTEKTTCEVTPKPVFVPNKSTGAIHILKPEMEAVMYQGKDLNEILVIILQALQDISEIKYYGITMFLDVLRGTATKRLTDAKLDHIPEFGSLSELSKDDLDFILEWLLKNHYMLRTKGRYPVLHPTNEGNHYDEYITRNKILYLRRELEKQHQEAPF